jgi:AbrB family looped-hinge helix DNA binding protein
MPENIIQISKISSNRQVTIPVEVMEKLKVKVGDKILWMEQDKNIIIRKT